MKTVEVKISGKEVLRRVSRMFDNSQESLFLEIFQNGRRAGATEIYVKELEDGIVIGNNGRPITDFQNLLTFGKSDWEEDVDYEDPAGVGFFATTLCDKVIVSSYLDGEGKEVEIKTNSLSVEGHKFHLKKVNLESKHFEHSTVEYTLKGNFMPLTISGKVGRENIEEIMARLPTKMFIEEKGLLREVKNIYDANIKNLVFDFKFNNLRYRIYNKYSFFPTTFPTNSHNTFLNYFGHII
ncbi:MAG: hypothetical protein U9N34_03745, partial [Candidatus Cloacimonadota bacterium]|nr:hypothetical protein [Candidatus Cloacimonadota bacterium]